MNYPFWQVPVIGSGWVIGIIAIYHVMISHFAVGGGFWLPLAERRIQREQNPELAKQWRAHLVRHSKFFLILTGVFGAVSGVGIWFAIGLTQPEATSTLIHNFVFGWAMEWVFFIVELTTAAVYYYTWGRISDKLHLTVGWVYAGASLCTLVIINGILTFMLTPGETWLAVAGTGNEASKFWNAFFNPTYWPSLLMRILVCTSLAGIWAMVTASRIDGDKQPELKTDAVKWSVRWLLPSFVLLPLTMVWYLLSVPETQRALLTLGMDTIGYGTFSQVTRMALVIIITSATIVGVAYFIAYRNPREFTFSHAVAILMLGLMATGAGEYAREMLRKPYVIGRHMYSNGERVSEVKENNQKGYLRNTLWLNQRTSLHFAQGEAMFRGECGSCHTLRGYRSLDQLLAGRDRQSVGNILQMLHENKPDSPYRRFMPPLTGTPAEIEALGDYLYYQSAGDAKANQLAKK
jgi:cytochrome bd-type quinol oxidase subunit 1